MVYGLSLGFCSLSSAEVTAGVAHEEFRLPAHVALEMATLNAARALGLDQRIGSLAKGKRADIVAVNLAAAELAPCYDPLSHLAYAAGREHVSHVWVDGNLLVENGALTQLEAGELAARADHWKGKIRSQD